jgi:hypothetical protein
MDDGYIPKTVFEDAIRECAESVREALGPRSRNARSGLRHAALRAVLRGVARNIIEIPES